MVYVSSAFSPLPFCAGVLRIYGYVAVVGAVIFVVIQLVSMLNFVFVWNDTWQANKKCRGGSIYHHLPFNHTLIPSSPLPTFFPAPPSNLSLARACLAQARVGSSGNRSMSLGSGSSSSAHVPILNAFLPYSPFLFPPNPSLAPTCLSLRHVLAAVVTGVCYVAVAPAAALMHLFFAPSSSCSLNLFFHSPPTTQARDGSSGNRSVLPGSDSSSSAHAFLLRALLPSPLSHLSYPSGTCWQQW
ncbi:unnamed protein product [Closterium sp. Naga37s-1]|nr:unnamed protein product [Closterium sp. Naga37s-1]